MLQQPRRGLDQLAFYHVVEHGAHGEEPLCRHAQIGQTVVVHQYLLDDEGCNSLGKVGPSFHDAEAQRDDLRLQQERDHLAVIDFNQGANHAKRGQPEVLEGAPLADCVQEGVQE